MADLPEFKWPFGLGAPFFVSSIDAWMCEPDQPGGIFERANRIGSGMGDRKDAVAIAAFFAPRGSWRFEDALVSNDAPLAIIGEVIRTAKRYRADNTWAALLAELVKIPGISYPLATGFLHAALEGEFPVIGEQPLWALGVPNMRAPRGKLTRAYVRFVREQADRESISVRSANAALWQRGRWDMEVDAVKRGKF